MVLEVHIVIVIYVCYGHTAIRLTVRSYAWVSYATPPCNLESLPAIRASTKPTIWALTHHPASLRSYRPLHLQSSYSSEFPPLSSFHHQRRCRIAWQSA
jgi:hypothetical protein